MTTINPTILSPVHSSVPSTIPSFDDASTGGRQVRFVAALLLFAHLAALTVAAVIF